MSSMTVRVEGMDDLRGILRALPTATQNRIIRFAARRAVKPVLAKAQAIAPVDSGKLLVELHSRPRKTGRRRRGKEKPVGFVVAYGNIQHMGLEKGDVYYPAVLEYGSAKKNIVARPTLRAALAATRDQAIAIFRQHISSKIVQVARKLNKNSPTE